MRRTRWCLWIPSLLALFLLSLRMPRLASQMLLNMGLVQLMPAVVAGEGEARHEAAVQSEALLQRAVTYAPESSRGWRALGYALAVGGQEERAVAVWQNADGVAEELLSRGQQAQWREPDEHAFRWYRLASEVDPNLGDAWYGMGTVYENMGQWEEALLAYRQAATADTLLALKRSSPYYRQGMIYQWKAMPRRNDEALAAYRRAVDLNDFGSDAEAANCHYQAGEVLRWLGGEPSEYLALYQQAVALDPSHASAHIYLGVAYYDQSRDVARAEAAIRAALTLEPANPWAYYQLGEIYRQEARKEEAIRMYEQALEIEPGFDAALERLRSLTGGK